MVLHVKTPGSGVSNPKKNDELCQRRHQQSIQKGSSKTAEEGNLEK